MMLALLEKGYPEFRNDQPRDNLGRWSSGGGSVSFTLDANERLLAIRQKVKQSRIGKSMKARVKAAKEVKREAAKLHKQIKNNPGVWPHAAKAGLASLASFVLAEVGKYLVRTGHPVGIALSIPVFLTWAAATLIAAVETLAAWEELQGRGGRRKPRRSGSRRRKA